MVTAIMMACRHALEELRGLDPAEHLVLDCEYVIEPHERGFVLKWLHNDVPVYQWIPPHRSPSSLQTRLRDHVNRTYAVNGEPMHKHRALALMHPCQELAGKYTCYVQTYTSVDRQSADLFIIVPESSLVLKYYRHPSDLVTVVCSAYGIFPAPEMSLWINDYRLENATVNELPATEGLFDSSVSVQLVLYESLQPDDVIKCSLAVPGTDYQRTKETVFLVADSRSFGDSNSILDPFGTVLASSSSINTDTLPPSSATELGRTTVPTSDAPTSSEAASTSTMVTSTKGTAGAQSAPPAKASTLRPQIPSLTRLRPTASSTRVLTVQQSNSVDSDETMNVLDFKEILNENLLYNSGGVRLAAGPARTGTDWLRFVAVMLPMLLLSVHAALTLVLLDGRTLRS
uniref:Ig-like domain-containing protein n=1 Tax=Anopheles atroparvus TaxID=41427 RepID=A0A182ITE5_ANOAO